MLGTDSSSGLKGSMGEVWVVVMNCHGSPPPHKETVSHREAVSLCAAKDVAENRPG